MGAWPAGGGMGHGAWSISSRLHTGSQGELRSREGLLFSGPAGWGIWRASQKSGPKNAAR